MKEEFDNDIIDLLSRPEFKQWILNPSKEGDYYWKKWIENNPSKKDSVYKAKEILLRLRFKQRDLSEEEVKQMLDETITADTSENQNSNLLRPLLKIAAVIVLLTSIGLTYMQLNNNVLYDQDKTTEQQYVTKSNPSGVKSTIKLPDGSTVVLNAGSKLTYPKTFKADQREVKLTGEAFFDISKDIDKPFIVISKDVFTTVLGTRFNIKAYPDKNDVSIALVSGKVAVNKLEQASDDYVLQPGEKITFNGETGYEHISDFDMIKEIGWKDGILLLENSGFDEFVTVLEKWYGVNILVIGSPDKEWNVDGKFDNESLEEILKGVRYTHNINYEINDNTVKIIFD